MCAGITDVIKHIGRTAIVPFTQDSPCAHIVSRNQDNESAVFSRGISYSRCIIAVIGSNGGIKRQIVTTLDIGRWSNHPRLDGIRIQIDFPIVGAKSIRAVTPSAARCQGSYAVQDIIGQQGIVSGPAIRNGVAIELLSSANRIGGRSIINIVVVAETGPAEGGGVVGHISNGEAVGRGAGNISGEFHKAGPFGGAVATAVALHFGLVLSFCVKGGESDCVGGRGGVLPGAGGNREAETHVVNVQITIRT